MVLAATFRVKNNTFAEQLRIIIQNNDTTQAIPKEIGQGDVKRFS